MSKYYLLWIGESASQLCAPYVEICASNELAMYEYVKELDEHYTENQYVVMTVKTIPALPFTDGKHIFTQDTCSVHEFIRKYKENYHEV